MSVGVSMYAVTKRIIDIIVALVGLVLSSPVTLILALVIGVNMGKPVFFSQVRPGRHGKPFRLVKFRTMKGARDQSGKLLPDEERLTPLGKWIRKTSLDEVPQLLNVLKGEMSLVGPRPLLMEYLPLYSPIQARRHDVKPGITGWAQVNGRNSISWNEKFELDIWYVDHQSLVLDLKIILHTFMKILRRDGVSHSNHATMPIFTGGSDHESL